tara:strand:- start:26396 stop:26839 length:444 start_codon:yes stop_codon:yes gene_type:complete
MKKSELEIRTLIASKLKNVITTLDEVCLQIPNLLEEVKDDNNKLENIKTELSKIMKEHYSKEAISKLPKLYSVPTVLRFIESEEKRRTGESLLIGLRENLFLATNESPGKDIPDHLLFQNLHHYKYVSDSKISDLKKRLDFFIMNLT